MRKFALCIYLLVRTSRYVDGSLREVTPGSIRSRMESVVDWARDRMDRAVRTTCSTREITVAAFTTSGVTYISVMVTAAVEAGYKTADMVDIGGGLQSVCILSQPHPSPRLIETEVCPSRPTKRR